MTAIGFAAVYQRTNTFARTSGSLLPERMRLWAIGSHVVDLFAGTRSVVGAFLDAAAQLGVTPVPLVAAYARAGGPVPQDELGAVVDQLVSASQKQELALDGLLLYLSGTLVTDRGTSGDSWILRQLRRALGNDFPIALLLDQCANVTPEMAELATLIVGSHRWPATDLSSWVWRALERLTATIERRIQPVVVSGSLPLLIPLSSQRTDREPWRSFMQRCRQRESQSGIVAVNCFAGFPYADVPEAGAAVVVVADGSAERAEEVMSEAVDELWRRRGELAVRELNIEHAVHTAMAGEHHRVVIAELGDAPEGGAPGEGTTALWALLDLGVRDAALVALADAAAVQAATRAGTGSRVELLVGGRSDRRHGYPIEVRGVVRRIADGVYRRRGPLDGGVVERAGPSVLIEAQGRHQGHFSLLLSSEPVTADDPGLLLALGIPPDEPRILVLKSAVDYLGAWAPNTVLALPAETPGITTPDLCFFPYQRVRRPIWPLDPL